MKVLVVDDSPINIKVATKLIEKLGNSVESANNGVECLEKVKNENYDMIFMDIMMPEMDGVETFQKLKEIENFNTPVITLTADADPGSKKKYLSLGFSAYLSKPINMEELKKVIDNLR